MSTGFMYYVLYKKKKKPTDGGGGGGGIVIVYTQRIEKQYAHTHTHIHTHTHTHTHILVYFYHGMAENSCSLIFTHCEDIECTLSRSIRATALGTIHSNVREARNGLENVHSYIFVTDKVN